MKKYGRRKVSIDHEKNIAIGCIVSTKFARDFNLLIGKDLDLLKSKYIRIIISWALEYYKTYNEAPTTSILDIFKAEKENLQSEGDKELIEDTLDEINNKYVEEELKFDVDYIFNQVEQYIKGRSLEENADQIKGLVKLGKIGEAEKIRSEYKRKEKNNTAGISAFRDMNALEELFIEDPSLFHIPGALGVLIKDIISTDYILLGGSSKRGKSYYAMQLAIYAVQSGLKVGYFTLEMDKKLFGRRIAEFIGGGSFDLLEDIEYIPYFDKNNNIKYEKTKIPNISFKKMKRKYKLFNKQINGGELFIFDTTTGGASLDAMKDTIINLSEYDDTDLDLIIIDQLSLISEGKGKERRHQLGEISAFQRQF